MLADLMIAWDTWPWNAFKSSGHLASMLLVNEIDCHLIHRWCNVVVYMVVSL